MRLPKILRGQRKPVQLQTDKGTEFTNRSFQAFLQDKDIRHFTTEGDTKARWNVLIAP